MRKLTLAFTLLSGTALAQSYPGPTLNNLLVNGGVVVGAAASGNRGAGTVNATGLYVNGVAINTGGITFSVVGADPTGSADSSTAFQTACTGATYSDDAIAVSPGKYKITTAPTCSNNILWQTNGATDQTGSNALGFWTLPGTIETYYGGSKEFWHVSRGNNDYANVRLDMTQNQGGGTVNNVTSNLVVNTTVQGAPLQGFWGINSKALAYDQITAANAAAYSGASGVVGIAGSAWRYTPTGGYSSGYVAAPIWGLALQANDMTGLDSSVTQNGVWGAEIDLVANGNDNSRWQGYRSGIYVAFARPNLAGATAQFANGLEFYSNDGSNVAVGTAVRVWMPVYQAGFSTAAATLQSGAVSYKMAGNQAIEFDGSDQNTTAYRQLFYSTANSALTYAVSGTAEVSIKDFGEIDTPTAILSKNATGVGVQLQGSPTYGFDASQATIATAAVRLAKGQCVALDVSVTMQVCERASDGKVVVYNGATAVWSIDGSGNVIAKGTVTQNGTP